MFQPKCKLTSAVECAKVLFCSSSKAEDLAEGLFHLLQPMMNFHQWLIRKGGENLGVCLEFGPTQKWKSPLTYLELKNKSELHRDSQLCWT